MRLIDVVKIANLDRNDLDEGFIEAIEGLHTYEDTELSEHLFSTDTLGEELSEDWAAELNKVADVCNRFDCSYFRIVEP